MPSPAETAVALYLYAIEAGTTAVSSQRGHAGAFGLDAGAATGTANSTFGTIASTPSDSSTAHLYTMPAEPSLTRADVAVSQLRKMEDWPANWDGSGSEKPILNSLRNAQRFVRMLAAESVIPMPTVHADGHAILFVRDHDTYAELEFLEDDLLGYYVRRGEREWADETQFDGYALPQGLSELGLRLERLPMGVAA